MQVSVDNIFVNVYRVGCSIYLGLKKSNIALTLEQAHIYRSGVPKDDLNDHDCQGGRLEPGATTAETGDRFSRSLGEPEPPRESRHGKRSR